MVMLGVLIIAALDPAKGMDNVHRNEPVDVRLLSGGPDGFGYVYLSTQDGDTGVTFNYIDVSTTGTAMGASDDWCSGYSASTLYGLGFSFPYYDTLTDSISICSNGIVILVNLGAYISYSNYPLPYRYTSAGFVAPLWDDLNPAASGSDDVYFEAFSSCPDGYPGACAVVQYHDVVRYGRTTPMDFEVIFYDNGNIKFQYNSIVDYVDATIGIQGDSADTTNDFYLEYVYDSLPSGHIPDSGTAILFVRAPATEVSEVPSNGSGLKVIGRTVYAEDGSVYDVSGRLLGTFKGKYVLPSRGLFFVRTGDRTYRIVVR